MDEEREKGSRPVMASVNCSLNRAEEIPTAACCFETLLGPGRGIVIERRHAIDGSGVMWDSVKWYCLQLIFIASCMYSCDI